MSDPFQPAERSAIMRAVRSRDTRPELAVRAIVRSVRRGYRLDARDIPGRPDIVFRGTRHAIFIDGCFWHGHDCARGARAPKANADYWAAKIARNRTRDAAVRAQLVDAGWKTLTVWECDLRDKDTLARRLRDFLTGP